MNTNKNTLHFTQANLHKYEGCAMHESNKLKCNSTLRELGKVLAQKDYGKKGSTSVHYS